MTLLRLNPIGIGNTGDENTQKNKNMQKIRRSAELFARCASFCMHSLENGLHFLTKEQVHPNTIRHIAYVIAITTECVKSK